jgi:hypothetical protein
LTKVYNNGSDNNGRKMRRMWKGSDNNGRKKRRTRRGFNVTQMDV